MDGETTIRTGEAYVSGALTALDDGARMRLFYELLAEVVESGRIAAAAPGAALPAVSDDVVVQRFLASLEQARHLPDGEIAALLRIGELDGEAALAIRDAVATGRLFGAGLRDLVGRYALRGADLGVLVLRHDTDRQLAVETRSDRS